MNGSGGYSIEIEPEIREWLAALMPIHYERVEAHADHLAENAETPGERCEAGHEEADTLWAR